MLCEGLVKGTGFSFSEQISTVNLHICSHHYEEDSLCLADPTPICEFEIVHAAVTRRRRQHPLPTSPPIITYVVTIYARCSSGPAFFFVMIVVTVEAVGCSCVWPFVGTCCHGFCVAVCGSASTMKVYGEVGVARSEVAGDDDDACDSSADVFPSL